MIRRCTVDESAGPPQRLIPLSDLGSRVPSNWVDEAVDSALKFSQSLDRRLPVDLEEVLDVAGVPYPQTHPDFPDRIRGAVDVELISMAPEAVIGVHPSVMTYPPALRFVVLHEIAHLTIPSHLRCLTEAEGQLHLSPWQLRCQELGANVFAAVVLFAGLGRAWMAEHRPSLAAAWQLADRADASRTAALQWYVEQNPWQVWALSGEATFLDDRSLTVTVKRGLYSPTTATRGRRCPWPDSVHLERNDPWSWPDRRGWPDALARYVDRGADRFEQELRGGDGEWYVALMSAPRIEPGYVEFWRQRRAASDA